MTETKRTTKAKAKASQARAKAGDAAQRAAEAIERNPLSILAGGIAIGAVAGALIPRSTREKTLLAGVGKRLAETTAAAVKAARDTGKEQLSASMLSKDTAKSSAQAVLTSALTAAKEASRKPTQTKATKAAKSA